MLHEEVSKESMQLGAKIGKLTAEEIRKAIDKLLAELKARTQHTTPTVAHGKQSLKALSAQKGRPTAVAAAKARAGQAKIT